MSWLMTWREQDSPESPLAYTPKSTTTATRISVKTFGPSSSSTCHARPACDKGSATSRSAMKMKTSNEPERNGIADDVTAMGMMHVVERLTGDPLSDAVIVQDILRASVEVAIK